VIEQTSTTANGIAAAASGITLALLGVDYYSLLYGMVGALLAMSQAAAMPRTRAIIYVILSTLVGAVFGNAALAVLGKDSRSLLSLMSIVGGAGAWLLVSALIRAAVTRIDKLGGQ
jgi:surface polysaccharide O-acyltransferase-like enzyme